MLVHVRLVLVFLAVHAVVALVVGLVDVARLVAPREQLSNQRLMVGIGGSDERVVLDIQLLPKVFVGLHHRIAVSLWFEARVGSGHRDLLTVLVGAGDHGDRPASKPLISGDHIDCHSGVSPTQVRRCVDIVQGCGDDEGLCCVLIMRSHHDTATSRLGGSLSPLLHNALARSQRRLMTMPKLLLLRYLVADPLDWTYSRHRP
mmetsp:Transcript_5285/g.15154  ORF Transcript_5285/g.15154 Transcript_5285/m.15154 type:complete len:203 (+) Transcript_5285:3790-4398(+)